MIKSKYINAIVAVCITAALIFATLVTLFPASSKAVEASATADTSYQEKLFDKTKIMTIDIEVDEASWSGMLENATAEEYIMCDVTINGTKFSSIGIRPKGNTSLTQVASDPTTDRYSFKLEFDHYISGQTCFGLDKFVLNNIQSDTTYLKEYLSYDLMEYMGVKSPLFAFADISINGETWGFYLAIEALEESYAARSFGGDYGQLYKVESDFAGGGRGDDNSGGFPGLDGNGSENSGRQGFPGGMSPPDMNGNQNGQPPNVNGGTANGSESGSENSGQQGFPGGFGGMGSSGGSDLVYTDDSPDSYSDIFSGAVFDTTDADEQRLIDALKKLGAGEDLESAVDVEAVLRYFAVNTFLVNLDSYQSIMKHNYYLYEKDGQLSVLPWDYNLSFAGFQSGTASSAVNFPIDTPVSGVDLSERPILAKLLEVDEYNELYHSYLQEIVDGYVGSGLFTTTVDTMTDLIKTYVQNDPTAFTTYSEFETGVKTLKAFTLLRAESVKGQLEGTVPSTSDAQQQQSAKLIDASSIELSDMGQQGGGGMMGSRGGRAGQDTQQGTEGQPEADGAGGDSSSTSDENSSSGTSGEGQQNGFSGGMGQNNTAPPGDGQERQTDGGTAGNPGNARGAFQNFGGMSPPGSMGQSGGNLITGILVAAGSVAALILALVFTVLFKRRKYCSR